MGQRSQIYIRIKDKNDKKTLFAKYYQWNYGERMISRARYGIEYIKRNFEFLGQRDVLDRINKIFDVNFDMQDIQISDNIFEDLKEIIWNNQLDVNKYIFSNIDNNDGKLFIDCDQQKNEIKYCFTDYDLKILSANDYMKWDIGSNWDSKDFCASVEDEKEWMQIVDTCKKNIKYINSNTVKMSSNELEQFINDDYEKQIAELNLDESIKI